MPVRCICCAGMPGFANAGRKVLAGLCVRLVLLSAAVRVRVLCEAEGARCVASYRRTGVARFAAVRRSITTALPHRPPPTP